MSSVKQTVPNRLLKEFHRTKLLFVLRLTILVIAASILVTKRTFWTPDTLFIGLLVIFVVFGQARSFLTRFLPLVSLLILYEIFRGIADDLNHTVHYTEMIIFDRFMFLGNLPTVVLQQWWWHGRVEWYDFYFYFLYTLHFLMPVLLAVLIWKKADKRYWQFMWALLLLSFAGFVTYIIFPAAPPWMASLHGYIEEPMRRVSSDIWWAMGINNFSEVYDKLPANQVAAVPSLHSAYPMLFSLFVTGIFGFKKYWWVYMYPISMWIGVVYMGEHYVIDVILGVMYATLAYLASDFAYNWYYYAPRRKMRRAVAVALVKLRIA